MTHTSPVLDCRYSAAQIDFAGMIYSNGKSCPCRIFSDKIMSRSMGILRLVSSAASLALTLPQPRIASLPAAPPPCRMMAFLSYSKSASFVLFCLVQTRFYTWGRVSLFLPTRLKKVLKFTRLHLQLAAPSTRSGLKCVCAE